MKPEWEKAATSGDAAAMQYLLVAHGADAGSLLNSKDPHGQTALMLAAMRGHTLVVDLLLRHGAEVNHTAKFHLSALMLAVINNHLAIVKMLIAAGADQGICGTGAPGFHQKSALDLARDAGRVEMVAVLSAAQDEKPGDEPASD